MGIFDKIRKHFRTKPNKEEQKKQPPNPKQIEWAKIAYEQALKNKSPFINHESAGAGELDEKIILTIAKANKFDIDDSCGLHEPIETYDEETLTAADIKTYKELQKRFSGNVCGIVIDYDEEGVYFIFHWKEQRVYEVECFNGVEGMISELKTNKGQSLETFIRSCKEAFNYISN